MVDVNLPPPVPLWENLLEVVEYEGNICGIITGSENLVEDFNMTLKTCAKILGNEPLRIKKFEGLPLHYVYTDTSWKLPDTGKSVHCSQLCLLAADPEIDSWGTEWWSSALTIPGYEYLVPEDIEKVKKHHIRLLKGYEESISYRINVQDTIKEKTVETTPYRGFSRTLLTLQHNV